MNKRITLIVLVLLALPAMANVPNMKHYIADNSQVDVPLDFETDRIALAKIASLATEVHRICYIQDHFAIGSDCELSVLGVDVKIRDRVKAKAMIDEVAEQIKAEYQRAKSEFRN